MEDSYYSANVLSLACGGDALAETAPYPTTPMSRALDDAHVDTTLWLDREEGKLEGLSLRPSKAKFMHSSRQTNIHFASCSALKGQHYDTPIFGATVFGC